MNFTIKGFKTWQTMDGGGYQFNLYLDNKKFAWVHNDGNGGCIDMQFYDTTIMGGKYHFSESPSVKIWDQYVKSLGQWKSDYSQSFHDHDTDTAIGELVTNYERNKQLAKARKKGVLFRLLTDGKDEFRSMNTLDQAKAIAYLDQHFGQNKYELI